MSRLQKRFLDCSGMTLEEAEQFGSELALIQRDIMFQIGDLARYAEARWPDTHYQVWPEWVSHAMLSRAAGVCRAYPKREDRRHEATYTQYMQNAGRPDRQARLKQIVDSGMTSDESRNIPDPEQWHRWLLAVDVNYFLHRFWHSGAGVEAASTVASWLNRTIERLKVKGLTDVVCCFDSATNHRKAITSTWDDKYKDRPSKEPELVQQLDIVKDLLKGQGWCCLSVDDMEADDVMASYAKQFEGRVTLLTQDKDMRQSLSEKCNILLDVEWRQDDTSGELVPDYKWVTAKSHDEETGVMHDLWTQYQCLMGDAVDGIKGAPGIGEKGAKDLINQFGTVHAVLEAAKAGNESIPEKKRATLIEFASKVEDTLRLVTLRTDLPISAATRIT